MNNRIVDPELYAKLEIPVSEAEARANFEAFWSEVCELRVKHKMPELVIGFAQNVKFDHGVEPQFVIGYRGGKYTAELVTEILVALFQKSE